jgi:two-component system, OmpR family, sensor histidine kinase KdpD
MRRSITGSAIGIGGVVILTAAMFPLRSHLSIATTGLVLVIPVVAGVIAGGYAGGISAVAAGFLVYDFVFIPPYYTLSVGAAQNWVALGVYVVVMLLVSYVVNSFQEARSEAQARATETERLFDISEQLVGDHSVDDLLETIVTSVQTAFGVRGVTLLLPGAGHLEVAASAGDPLDPMELGPLDPESGVPVSVGVAPANPGQLRVVSLSASGRPVGLLALTGLPASEADRDLLRIFANHAALALERAQLRARALRSEVLEAADQVRRDLLGAVSHDLRTPLASMKVASSTLLDPDAHLSGSDVEELHELLDVQTDRLTRLVTSLLDMTRYQAGVLVLKRVPSAVLDLVGEAVAGIRAALGDRPVEIDLSPFLPPVDVDPVLIGQVLINLIDNADRHAPPGTPVVVGAELQRGRVVVSVSDRGPGVPRSEREAVFESFHRFDTGGRAGLGLSIAKTFVEVHGERIWVEEMAGGGARFSFSLPVSPADARR